MNLKELNAKISKAEIDLKVLKNLRDDLLKKKMNKITNLEEKFDFWFESDIVKKEYHYYELPKDSFVYRFLKDGLRSGEFNKHETVDVGYLWNTAIDLDMDEIDFDKLRAELINLNFDSCYIDW